MSSFDIDTSLARAEQRFRREVSDRPRSRRERSDRGRARLPAPILAALAPSFSAQERPSMATMLRAVAEPCRRAGRKMPSRATIYRLMAAAPGPSLAVGELPAHVRETLYNLEGVERVPGHQLVFHCFNYGGIEAVSFAAGLPWLTLYQAARLRGFRPKSRGLLEAVLRVRKI